MCRSFPIRLKPVRGYAGDCNAIRISVQGYCTTQQTDDAVNACAYISRISNRVVAFMQPLCIATVVSYAINDIRFELTLPCRCIRAPTYAACDEYCVSVTRDANPLSATLLIVVELPTSDRGVLASWCHVIPVSFIEQSKKALPSPHIASTRYFSVPAFFLVLREVLEACLVVGIMLAYLNKTGNTYLRRYVWFGALTGVLLSLVVGGTFVAVYYTKGKALLKGRAENIFEGVVFLVAAMLLSWGVLWVQSLSRHVQNAVENATDAILDSDDISASKLTIFAVVFVQVLREGIETFVFLLGASGNDKWTAIPIPGVLGLASQALHELQEANVFGDYSEENSKSLDWWNAPMWNMRSCCSAEDNEFFAFMRALFGYQDSPSFVEISAYFLYWLLAAVTVLAINWHLVRAAKSQAAKLVKVFSALALTGGIVSFAYSLGLGRWNGILVSTLLFVLSIPAVIMGFDAIVSRLPRWMARMRRGVMLSLCVCYSMFTLLAISLHVTQMACDEPQAKCA
eukprot:IDg15352t1